MSSVDNFINIHLPTMDVLGIYIHGFLGWGWGGFGSKNQLLVNLFPILFLICCAGEPVTLIFTAIGISEIITHKEVLHDITVSRSFSRLVSLFAFAYLQVTFSWSSGFAYTAAFHHKCIEDIQHHRVHLSVN